MKSEWWGGFDFGDIYQAMVDRFNSGTFVELGAWEGESAIFMAKAIKKSKKDIQFYTIDLWQPYPVGNLVHYPNYELYLSNIDPYKDYINTMRCDSAEAADHFKKVDFVFIDACHDYEAVKRDIMAWLPKVTGVIAGHDYTADYPGVEKAVDEIFGHDRSIIKSSWLHEVNQKLFN
jgi:hypothetical protein